MKIINEITIEVTQQCYSNCIFCSSLSNESRHCCIPLEKIKEVINFSKKYMAKEINISGGEPFIRKDLSQIISYSLEKEVVPVIYTSGNVDMLDVVDIFKNSFRIIFNFPSVDKDEFEVLTGGGSYDRVLKNIEYCIEKGINTGVHIVPSKINSSSINKTCDFLKNINISNINILKLVVQGRAKKYKDLLEPEARDEYLIEEQLESIRSNSDLSKIIRLGIPLGGFNSTIKECHAGKSKLVVKYNGDIFPCEAFKEIPNSKKYIVGNIYKNEIEDIWNNLDKTKFINHCKYN